MIEFLYTIRGLGMKLFIRLVLTMGMLVGISAQGMGKLFKQTNKMKNIKIPKESGLDKEIVKKIAAFNAKGLINKRFVDDNGRVWEAPTDNNGALMKQWKSPVVFENGKLSDRDLTLWEKAKSLVGYGPQATIGNTPFARSTGFFKAKATATKWNGHLRSYSTGVTQDIDADLQELKQRYADYKKVAGNNYTIIHEEYEKQRIEQHSKNPKHFITRLEDTDTTLRAQKNIDNAKKDYDKFYEGLGKKYAGHPREMVHIYDFNDDLVGKKTAPMVARIFDSEKTKASDQSLDSYLKSGDKELAYVAETADNNKIYISRSIIDRVDHGALVAKLLRLKECSLPTDIKASPFFYGAVYVRNIEPFAHHFATVKKDEFKDLWGNDDAIKEKLIELLEQELASYQDVLERNSIFNVGMWPLIIERDNKSLKNHIATQYIDYLTSWITQKSGEAGDMLERLLCFEVWMDVLKTDKVMQEQFAQAMIPKLKNVTQFIYGEQAIKPTLKSWFSGLFSK
jgi:hypothetical protein